MQDPTVAGNVGNLYIVRLTVNKADLLPQAVFDLGPDTNVVQKMATSPSQFLSWLT
ncbi:hypothetical protein EYZ11_010617 [Aspergillus tanneri]|uniref:Uncharacterized protein n=1 Tax=Aspergillus tanneri TaxID=1220188 RepID=A0A4S3J4W3_9EURO|nr:hypothetical protein EYZ11_010617 [Aspergillus tanneri]